MSFHRIDSSALIGETVHRAAKHLPNALRAVSERLNSILECRLSGVSSYSADAAPPPFKAGEAASDERNSIPVFKRDAYLFLDKLEVAKLSFRESE
jgi:hypothetical protein